MSTKVGIRVFVINFFPCVLYNSNVKRCFEWLAEIHSIPILQMTYGKPWWFFVIFVLCVVASSKFVCVFLFFFLYLFVACDLLWTFCIQIFLKLWLVFFYVFTQFSQYIYIFLNPLCVFYLIPTLTSTLKVFFHSGVAFTVYQGMII